MPDKTPKLRLERDAKSPSGFVGVSRNGKPWRARVSVNGQSKHLGFYDKPRDGAVAIAEFYARNDGPAPAPPAASRVDRAAAAASQRASRIARLRVDPTLAPHGLYSTRINWGCGCAACKAAPRPHKPTNPPE